MLMMAIAKKTAHQIAAPSSKAGDLARPSPRPRPLPPCSPGPPGLSLREEPAKHALLMQHCIRLIDKRPSLRVSYQPPRLEFLESFTKGDPALCRPSNGRLKTLAARCPEEQ